MAQDTLQAELVTQSAIDPTQTLGKVALFDADGTPIVAAETTPAWASVTGADTGARDAIKTKTAVAALTAVSTADAEDEETAIALVNALKTAVNALIAALKA